MYNKESDRHKAQFLYLQTDLTQTEISDLLTIDRKTLYNWIRDGNWKRAKYTLKYAPMVLQEQYYTQLGAINAAIAERTERPYATKEEAEIIRKLSVTIKHVEGQRTTLSNIFEVFEDFACALRLKNGDKAKEMVPLMDDYIHAKVNEANGLDKPWWTFLDNRKEDQVFEQYQRDQEQFIKPQRTKERWEASEAGNPHIPFIPIPDEEELHNELEEKNCDCRDAMLASPDNGEFEGESAITENTPKPATDKDYTINNDTKISPNEDDGERGNSPEHGESDSGNDDLE